LNMPRLNGVQVLEELKRQPGLRSIPVIIYSTSFDSYVYDHCTKLGAVELIEKPNCFDTLCSKLESVFHTMA
jgi:CheY-like chemotaxis protein